MGVEPYNFVSALNCILAQRLVRVICEKCKREAKVSRELLETSNLPFEKYGNVVFYEGSGCIECNGTGFRGRHAIGELLALNDEIREMILARKSAAEIKKKAKEDGMVFLREAAIEKVVEGLTTLQEINKVTFVE